MRLFLDITDPDEIAIFTQWARDNYVPFSEIKGIWHPITQSECVKMNAEAEVGFINGKIT